MGYLRLVDISYTKVNKHFLSAKYHEVDFQTFKKTMTSCMYIVSYDIIYTDDIESARFPRNDICLDHQCFSNIESLSIISTVPRLIFSNK